jgi:hypothetical protein
MGIFPAKILLATDGSGEAASAANTAIDMANLSGSELHVGFFSSMTGLRFPASAGLSHLQPHYRSLAGDVTLELGYSAEDVEGRAGHLGLRCPGSRPAKRTIGSPPARLPARREDQA